MTNQTDLKTQAPEAIEVEKALLGALLIAPDNIAIVATMVTKDDFFLVKHGIIYDAILSAKNSGQVDHIIVSEYIEKSGHLSAIGYAYLMDLIINCPDSTAAPVYAGLVKSVALRRDLLTLSDKMRGSAFDETTTVTDILADCKVTIDKLIGSQADLSNTATMQSIASDLYDHLMTIAFTGGSSGYKTGFPDLDDATNGLEARRFWVIAGRPGMGKSAFVDTMTLNLAMNGTPVIVFCGERTKQQVTRRFISQLTGISYHEQTKPLSQAQLKRMGEVIGQLSELPISIDDTPAPTVAYIEREARKFKAQHSNCVVVYDGMYRGNVTQKVNSLHEKFSIIAQDLKTMAGTLDLPVITTHQLNRDGANDQPKLHHLRDSGTIEQEADVVLLLHRDGYHDKTQDNGSMLGIIAKNRDGESATIPLWFDSAHTRVYSADKHTIKLPE